MTKIFPLIQIANKLYAIDKEAILTRTSPYIRDGELFKEGSDSHGICDCIGIIASQDETLGIALLPNIEEDIDNILLKYRQNHKLSWDYIIEQKELLAIKTSNWYKTEAAKAKQYTEKDIQKAFQLGENRGKSEYKDDHINEDEYLQSLFPIPTHVELEMEYIIEDFSGSMNVPTYADEATPIVKDGFVIVKQWHYEKQSKI